MGKPTLLLQNESVFIISKESHRTHLRHTYIIVFTNKYEILLVIMQNIAKLPLVKNKHIRVQTKESSTSYVYLK